MSVSASPPPSSRDRAASPSILSSPRPAPSLAALPDVHSLALFGALLRFPLAPEEEGESSAKEHDNCKARGIASCAVFFTSVLLSSFIVAPRKQCPLLRQFSYSLLTRSPARPPHHHTIIRRVLSATTIATGLVRRRRCTAICAKGKSTLSGSRVRRAARERKRPIFGGTRQQQGLVRELLSGGDGSSGDDSLHVRPRPRVQSFDSSWEGGRKMRAPFSRSRSRSLLSSHHRCKRVAFACLAVPPAHVRIVDPPRPEGRGEHCT